MNTILLLLVIMASWGGVGFIVACMLGQMMKGN